MGGSVMEDGGGEEQEGLKVVWHQIYKVMVIWLSGKNTLVMPCGFC